MRKTLLSLFFAAASVASVAQVSWTPTLGTPITFTGTFVRTDAPLTNLFLSDSSNIYSGETFTSVDFSGTDSINSQGFTFEAASASDTGNFNFLGSANFRFTLGGNATTINTVTADAGTYHFHFDIPTTSAGEITGFTVVNDPNSISSVFSFAFDGSGGVDITQPYSFSVAPLAVSSFFTGNFTATAAIPEPATTTLCLAGAVVALAFWRRRGRPSRQA